MCSLLCFYFGGSSVLAILQIFALCDVIIHLNSVSEGTKLSPVKLLQLRLRPEVIPCIIGVLRHYDNKQTETLDVKSLIQEAREQEVSDTGRTDDVRGDACLGEQRGDLLLVDAFSLFLPAKWVDVDQQVFWSAGCK